MPLYEYAPVSGECQRCHGRFEVMQRLADEKLAQCPACGQACERCISAVALGGRYGTSDAAVKKAGFTKFRSDGSGGYERTVGNAGPASINRGSSGDDS